MDNLNTTVKHAICLQQGIQMFEMDHSKVTHFVNKHNPTIPLSKIMHALY